MWNILIYVHDKKVEKVLAGGGRDNKKAYWVGDMLQYMKYQNEDAIMSSLLCPMNGLVIVL